MTNPMLHIGWDLGVKRDTTAVVALYHDTRLKKFILWGHRCIDPKITGQVDIPVVGELIVKILQTQRVGGVWYDEWQLYSEAQRIAQMGYGHLLHPVNQQQDSVLFSNNLSSAIDKGDIVLYSDKTIRAHITWTGAEVTERGYRIVKRNQNKPIDLTVAIAIALYGAMKDSSYLRFSAFNDDRQQRAVALP